MRKEVYGTCMKCGTENSLLYEYRPDYWICKANECVQEDTEKDSERHIKLKDELNDLSKLCQGTSGGTV